MSKRRAILAICCIALLAVVLGLWSMRARNMGGPDDSVGQGDVRPKIEPKAVVKDEVKAQVFEEAFMAPVSFYGKVVDESGAPISGAAAKLMAVDKPWAKSTVYERTSDSQGLFSLTGAKGAALSIDVSKGGYYSTATSRGRFVFGGVRNPTDPKNPTQVVPAVFVLKRMGETELLEHVPLKTIKIPKDGQPVKIDLSTGKTALNSGGDLVVECRTSNQGLDPNRNQHYAWRSRVSIDGGGLAERKGDFDFEAPTSGYVASLEFEMSASAQQWKSGVAKQFFAKLRDGRFARLNLELETSGDHFVVLESYVNPTPGHRNLEFDPAKTVRRESP